MSQMCIIDVDGKKLIAREVAHMTTKQNGFVLCRYLW